VADQNFDLDNEWLCPYCLAQTKPGDKRCPACKQSLIVSTRIKTKPSVWLWRGIVLQIGAALILVSLWTVSMVFVLRRSGIPRPSLVLPLYFGLSIEQPEFVIETALGVYPRRLFWSFLPAVLISTLLIFVLYFRIKHGNTVYLISACLLLSAGITIVLFLDRTPINLVIGGFCVVLGAGQLIITMNLWNDFKFKSGRLRMRIDKGAKNHTSLYLSSRKYAELKMWGLSALHLRWATGRHPRKAVYHMALAVSYMKLKRYELAEKSLDSAEEIDPDAIEIWQLRKQLNARRKGGRG